jgi:hypothetical protein
VTARLDRRRFVALAAATPLVATHAQASSVARPILLFDPALAAAVQIGDAARARGADVRAIAGDRVRYAAALLAARPARLAGITSYADFLLLSGAAEETGLRLTGSTRHCDGVHRCSGAFAPARAMLYAAGDAWPAALADLLLGIGDGGAPVRVGSARASLVSWTMVRTGALV